MHEYSKTISRFYDPIYEKLRSPVDREFYLERIAEAKGPVLEVGVGTGRIFYEALERGADIYGIDLSENMLEILKEKLPGGDRARVMQGDMTDFDLGKKYKLIIVPFRIFQHLLTTEEQLKALKCIKEHLDDDGKLIFDVFIPNLKRITESVRGRLEAEVEYEPGKEVQRFLDSEPDNINQVIDITFTFKWKDNGTEKSEKDNFPFRYYFRYELEHMLYRAGLNILHMYGDFDKGELTKDSTDFVIVCSK